MTHNQKLQLRLLVADHAPTRLGIQIALDGEIEACAEASSADEAIRAAMNEQPDVCLVGRELPGDWLAAVRGIGHVAPGAAIVVLAETGDVDDLLDAVQAGAIGYVPGGLNAASLRRVIRAVRDNQAIVPRALVLELILDLRRAGTRGGRLTAREGQVLRLLRGGYTTTAIAERLEIAPVTVRRHVSDIVHKLGVDNRAALSVPSVS